MVDAAVPIGGSTGLCHAASGQVEIAADWLSRQIENPGPVVPVLKERFGLSAVEACEAIALARRPPVRRKSDAA